MPPLPSLLGTPHPDLNTYIQTLKFYSLRLQRGHSSIHIPTIPTFTLPDAPPTEPLNPSALHNSDTSLLGNEAEDSLYTLSYRGSRISTTRLSIPGTAESDKKHTLPSPFPFQTDFPDEVGMFADGDGRPNTAVLSRFYHGGVVEGLGIDVPVPLPREEEEEEADAHPYLAETYGWRLVGCENVVNVVNAIAWRRSDKSRMSTASRTHSVKSTKSLTMTEERKQQLVYHGNTPSKLDTIIAKGFQRMNGEAEIIVSPNPQTGLAYSPWHCPVSSSNSATSTRRESEPEPIHDPSWCAHPGKRKSVLVCALLDLQPSDTETADKEYIIQDPKSLLPLRLETYEWNPRSVEEVRKYAEYAVGLLRGLDDADEEVEEGEDDVAEGMVEQLQSLTPQEIEDGRCVGS